MLRKPGAMFLVLFVIPIFLAPISQTLAQDEYPSRPIEIIVPWPAGSTTDLGVRYLADKWAEFLGQPVITVNKAGASGSIGSKFVARAKPDGYTLLSTGDSALISSPSGKEDPGYDLDSFRMLFTYSKLILFFTVRSDSRWKTLNDFLIEAKNNPGKLKYGTFGPYSSTVMSTDMLCKAAGINLTLVPFKSTPDSLTAVMGGNVDIAVTWGLSGLGKSGMIRPLAVASEQRAPDYLEVPTLKELGYPIEYTGNYNGLAIPSKTPENVVSKLIEAHNKVRTKYSREISERLPAAGGQYFVYEDGKLAMEQLKVREGLFRKFYERVGYKPN